MGILSHTPAAGVNAALNKTFDCSWLDSSGTYPLGIPSITMSGTGTWLNVGVIASPGIITLSAPTNIVVGELWTADAGIITLSGSTVDIITEAIKKNWVKWSNIGHLDFTVWKDNIAGERPMDWKGWVYGIRKHHNKVVVYGENGVTALMPSGNSWGMQTLYQLGLKGKHAHCGTDSEHYFVDVEGRLWRYAETLEKLDYSEYLSTLTSTIVMSLDKETGLIYICDGQYGYVYSPRDNSMGSGPTNITGIGSQSGTLYVTAPATVSTPTCEICTDIFDFGTRRAKSIHNVQIGTDLTNTLYAALDFRRDKSQAFTTTPWRVVNADGTAFINCHGTEFRVRVKSAAYEYLELDYITFNGAIHDY